MTQFFMFITRFDPFYIFLQVALRIRPMKNEERTRGFRNVAEKVDDRVIISKYRFRGGGQIRAF